MVSSVDTSQHSTDTPDSGALTDPSGDTTLPLPPPLVNTLITDSAEEEDRERVIKEKMIEYFRTGQGTLKKPLEQGATFVTFNTPLVTTPTQSISCTESIKSTLLKRRIESHVDPSANVSVREALRTRGEIGRAHV